MIITRHSQLYDPRPRHLLERTRQLKGSEIWSVILDLRNCGFDVARSDKVEASVLENC